MRSGLYFVARNRLAKRETPGAMEFDAGSLCGANFREPARRSHRYRPCHESLGADMDIEAGNRIPRSGRIESVLDWARVRGYREGENPARWRGHLDHLLPKRGRLTRGHHAALPWHDVPTFFEYLTRFPSENISAPALRFLILTAARTGEVIGARWNEFDFKAKIWAVPAARMKAGREHRVPLSDAALAVLEIVPRIKGEPRVFPISNMAMPMLLRRIGTDTTVHGFRSSFRDWCAESTNFPRELAERALAHALSDKVEAAYQRGDMFEKRRRLMQAWADYCTQPVEVAEVINLLEHKA
jgi:integrase